MSREAIFYLPFSGEAVPPGEMRLGDLDLPVIEGVDVVACIGDGDGPARSGHARALELIAAGRAGVLVVAQLRDGASSLGELVRLLDWLEEACADLIAIDVGFDSGEIGARGTVALLREVERWDREPHPARRPRGRPGLSSTDPELAQRLALLRERGLSLHAISATLNAEGVPTPRGGVKWRPSSVQAALGYRRPRAPAPGAPVAPPQRAPDAGGRHAPPPPGPGAPGPSGPGAPRPSGPGAHSRHDPPGPPPLRGQAGSGRRD